MLSEVTIPYSKQRLPDLIKSLKSQVDKNLLIVNKPVERDLSSDKFFNVLKGRKMAAELAINSMHKIDQIEQELEVKKEESYFNEKLPELIEHLKEMFDINLKVVDIDVDEEDIGENLASIIKDDLNEIFGPEVTKRVLKKVSPGDSLSEDKYANVIKARGQAVEDNQWVLKKIDELENLLNKTEVVQEKKPSVALRMAQIKQN